jgi:hypothetical protein
LNNSKPSCIISTSLGDDFDGDYKLCQEKFLLAEQHKKDGLVQPVAQGKPKNDAKKNGNNQKKPRHESGSKYPSKKYNGKCGYCTKWGHREDDCTNNPANNKSAAHGSKRQHSANTSSAGGNKKPFLRKEAWAAKMRAKELEQNQKYDAYCLEFAGNDEYTE